MDYDDGISQNLMINNFNYEPKDQDPDFLYYQNIGPQGLIEKQ